MLGGTTDTVLSPLRTIAGAGGGGGGDNDSGKVSAVGETTTTDLNATARPRRTTTTAPGATTTTRRPSRTTTTVAPTPTTTGTTPPTAPIGDCKAADLGYTTATNKGSYRPNDPVQILLRVRNGSDRPCYAPPTCGVGPWASVQNSEGATVWKNAPRTTGCGGAQPPAPLLGPRDTYDYGVVGTWNQLECPDGDGCAGPHAAVGSYRAVAHRGSITANGATFALR